MERLKKDTFFNHLTKKPIKPYSKEDAISLITSYEEKYMENIKRTQESDFSEKERIARGYLSELTTLKYSYDDIGDQAFVNYGIDKLELAWFFERTKEAFSSLADNPNTSNLYDDCDNIYSSLFEKFYYETMGTKIYMESPLGLFCFSLEDTEIRPEYGKMISEDEIINNPDGYIEITKEECFLFEEFFMQDLNSWYSMKVRKAVTFALYYLTGKKRKISRMPFIAHPLDTMIIASTLTLDQDVLISAMLHGILKQPDVDPMGIKKYFGLDIAKKIVYINGMEDNMNNKKDWTVAKKDILYKLDNASMDIKIIILSNELSKLREIDRDFQIYKDSVWEHFSEKDKKKHRWYHEEVLRNMSRLRVSYAYEEYQKLIYLHLNNTYN